MLDTKLKKTHRLAALLIALSILLPATVLVALYPRMEQVYLQQTEELEGSGNENWVDTQLEVREDFVNYAVEASYYMYGQFLQESLQKPVDFSVLDQYGWINDYYTLVNDTDFYAEYQENDFSAESNSSYELQRFLVKDNTALKDQLIREMSADGYIGYLILTFDAYGNISDVDFKSFEESGVSGILFGNPYEQASHSIRQYENNVAYYNSAQNDINPEIEDAEYAEEAEIPEDMFDTDESELAEEMAIDEFDEPLEENEAIEYVVEEVEPVQSISASGAVDPLQLRPKNFRGVFALNEDSEFLYMNVYDNEASPLQIYFNMGAEWIVVIAAVFVMLMALILPFFKKLETGNEKLFSIPLEVIFCIAIGATGGIVLMYEIMTYSSYTVLKEILNEYGGLKIIGYSITAEMLYKIMLVANFLGWAFCFFMEYIVVAAFRQFLCGPIRYLKEKCLFIVFLRWIKRKCVELYHYVTDIQIGSGMKKSIIKIVLANFAILFLLCCMWVFGVVGLIIYSIALYVLLMKYGSKIQGQYENMVYTTGQMAEGNLKVELSDDLGVFTELGEELKKVQSGFSKAVAEEAKSQNMKTELITNVSHDLKTPLTAIITYVDLLKKENLTQEERNEYVETLDKKSQRLKVLIEDLFEVSKASSNNITMYYADVDLVNLLKQVCLENEDKIKESTLDIRWMLPDKKCMAHLDPNRTYRIIDNLLQNALKYSMPHSRVYVDMEEMETEYVICFKNMSATEMNFNASEITERFVRGDLSRNTEGSGLGLAIAQSFTELQNGKFIVEIDGDLFKVTLRFPKM